MKIANIDLNLLRAFVAVFETSNISHAAESIGLSQPAMSNALARLRKQVDDPLFVRSGNGVTPTSKARVLIVPVRRALQDIERALITDRDFDPETAERTFRLILADPVEPLLLPKLVKAVLPYRGLSLELVPPQAHEVEGALDAGIIDLAVFLQPKRLPDILCEPVCTFELVLIARQGHPVLARQASLDVFREYGFASLFLKPNMLANNDKIKFWQRIGVRSVIAVSRAGAIAQIVSKSELLGIVPRIYADAVAEELGLAIIEPPSAFGTQKVFSIWHERNDQEAAVLWLREKIRAAFISR